MKTDISLKVYPIYCELQGYLDQAPRKDSGSIREKSIWEQLHQTIDELNAITGNSYDKFKTEIKSSPTGFRDGGYYSYIDVDSYRTKVGGLINKLYGEYFSDEQKPFSNVPSTIINASQTQLQAQEQHQSVLVDIAIMIAEKKHEYAIGTPERNFLDKITEYLKSAKDVKQIVFDIVSLAAATGVSLEFLKKIFGS